MGNVVSGATPATATTSALEAQVAELQYYTHSTLISNTRFLKTLQVQLGGISVIVKIFATPPNLSIDAYIKRLDALYAQLAWSNAVLLPLKCDVLRNGWGIMVRQHMYTSLYDRISTRPFLSIIEKKWITYQLLAAAAECHSNDVCHGDIKAENVLLTSWNWLYLSDFACEYKPTRLPDDYPAQFSFYFDTSGRRSCYVAPERFVSSESIGVMDDPPGATKLEPSMDIFSIGCVIAELFLEGSALFDLPRLLAYRVKEYDPAPLLAKIEDKAIRDLVTSMIQLDPSARLQASEYLSKYRGSAFPLSFSTFLHQYTLSLTDPNNPSMDPDTRVDKIYQEFDKISHLMGLRFLDDTPHIDASPEQRTLADMRIVPPVTVKNIAAVTDMLSLDPALCIPNMSATLNTDIVGDNDEDGKDSILVIVSIICSSLRYLSFPVSKLRAMDMLLALGAILPDRYKLDRVLPYLSCLFSDANAVVRAAALRTTTQLVQLVSTVAIADTNLFSEYLLPMFAKFSEDTDVVVSIMYARCIGALAVTAVRYIEHVDTVRSERRANGTISETDIEAELFSFEAERDILQTLIGEEVSKLSAHSDPNVSRALFSGLVSLCRFFGQQHVYMIQQLLATHMNSLDWQLRCAFFESTVNVVNYVGHSSFDHFMRPFLMDGLGDEEQYVVAKTIATCERLARLGLLSRSDFRQQADTIAPFLCHPSISIRYSAVGFLACASSLFQLSDVHCLIVPLLKPYLMHPLLNVTEANLLAAVRPPVQRLVLDQAFVWGRRYLQKQEKDKLELLKQADAPARAGEASRLTRTRTALNIPPSPQVPALNASEHVDAAVDSDRLAALSSSPPADALSGSGTPSLTGLGGAAAADEEFHRLVSTIDRPALMGMLRPQLSRARAKEDDKDRNVRSRSGGAAASAASESVDAVVSLPSSNTKMVRGLLERKDSVATTMRRSTIRRDERPYATSSMEDLADEFSGRARTSSSPRFNSFGEDATSGTGKLSPAASFQHAVIAGDGSPSRAHLDPRQTAPGVHVTSGYASSGFTSPSSTDGGDASRTIYSLDMLADRRVSVLRAVHSDARRMTRMDTRPLYPSWKPEGVLVAHITEDTAAINVIAVAPDKSFFVTGSQDGMLHVFDPATFDKFDRNTMNTRPRVSCRIISSEPAIRCITFLERSHVFAVGSQDGCIRFYHVECPQPAQQSSNVPATGFAIGLLATWKPYGGGFPLAMEQYTVGGKVLLAYVLSSGVISCADVRQWREEWTFELDRPHDPVVAFVIDRRRQWMLAGTARGQLILYDLRFLIKVRVSSLPPSCTIERLVLHPTTNRVLIATSFNEVIVWSVETGEPTQVYGAVVMNMSRYTTGDWSKVGSDVLPAPIPTPSEPRQATRALLVPSDMPFFFSAGTDRLLLCWDTTDPDKCHVISGVKPGHVAVFKKTAVSGVDFFEITQDSAVQPSTSAAMRIASSMKRYVPQPNLAHANTIQAIAFLDGATPMIVSGDCDGVIKVWK